MQNCPYETRQDMGHKRNSTWKVLPISTDGSQACERGVYPAHKSAQIGSRGADRGSFARRRAAWDRMKSL